MNGRVPITLKSRLCWIERGFVLKIELKGSKLLAKTYFTINPDGKQSLERYQYQNDIYLSDPKRENPFFYEKRISIQICTFLLSLFSYQFFQ